MIDTKKTGRVIRIRRTEAGLTQDQLAQKINFTPAAVSAWENGVRYPGPDAQLGLFNALGLNPVELLTGLEMFDDDLTSKIAAHMKRMDEEVFVAGWGHDEDGNPVYLDLSNFEIVTTDSEGNLSDKWIPYTRFHNVELPDKSDAPEEMEKTEYQPDMIYINKGHSIFVIPIEILLAIGKPLFCDVLTGEDDLDVAIRFSNEKGTFDIPREIYNGQWRGLHIYGGEFGHELCRTMRVRHVLDTLEVKPFWDAENNTVYIHLDEAQLVKVDIEMSKYMLPGWQYEELWADEDDEEED